METGMRHLVVLKTYLRKFEYKDGRSFMKYFQNLIFLENFQFRPLTVFVKKIVLVHIWTIFVSRHVGRERHRCTRKSKVYDAQVSLEARGGIREARGGIRAARLGYR